jgi:putative intracellular protease/amidase
MLRLVISFFVAWFAMIPSVHAGQEHTRVAILMFDGVQIIDFAGPYEVFGQAGFDVFTVSANGTRVTTSMDLKVDVDHSFADAPQADILLIPGGHVDDAERDQRTLEFLKKQAAEADQVLSVCTGSFVLAATGLLDGKVATTFHSAFEPFAKRYPAVKVVRDRRWADAGKIVTAAGLSSGIDAAIHVVAEVRGLDAARTVASTLEYDWTPNEREGYIRGLMADQHIRYPAEMTLPEGTHVHPLRSIGDQRQWSTLFHVVSPVDQQSFINDLRARAERDEALQVARTAPGTASWQHTDAAGKWRVTIEPDREALPEGYGVLVKVAKLD